MAFELGNDGPQTVLVGVDGSRTSLRAVAYAAGLARRNGSLLIAVHVARPPALSGLAPTSGVLYQQTLGEVADELRDELTLAARDAGVRLEFVAEAGDAYDRLLRTADARRVDVVVVGASEKAGHWLVGSLASRLVRAGKWPVTVVP